MGKVFKVFLASGNLTSRIYQSQNFSLEFSRQQLPSTSDTCFLKCYGSSGRSQGSGQVLRRSSRRRQPGSHRDLSALLGLSFPGLGTGLPQKALSMVYRSRVLALQEKKPTLMLEKDCLDLTYCFTSNVILSMLHKLLEYQFLLP